MDRPSSSAEQPAYQRSLNSFFSSASSSASLGAMKNCSDSAEQPAHDREDCKQNANTDDSDGWRNFCHADTWAQLMREPSASPVSEAVSYTHLTLPTIYSV